MLVDTKTGIQRLGTIKMIVMCWVKEVPNRERGDSYHGGTLRTHRPDRRESLRRFWQATSMRNRMAPVKRKDKVASIKLRKYNALRMMVLR